MWLVVFFVVVVTLAHAVFGGFISISGGWTLSCKEFIVAEDSLHLTTQCLTF